MKFEPGEIYEMTTGGGALTVRVWYIGISPNDGCAIVEQEAGAFVHRIPFSDLKPVKKKQRLFIALPEHSVCSPPNWGYGYTAYVATDLARLKDRTKEPAHTKNPFPWRYIELETVEPQDPL